MAYLVEEMQTVKASHSREAKADKHSNSAPLLLWIGTAGAHLLVVYMHIFVHYEEEIQTYE